MKKLALVLALTSLVIVNAYAAQPKQVTLKGEMVCMFCDCVAPCTSQANDIPHKCMAAFKSDKGDVYTLAPTESAKDLVMDIKMHEQKVEIKGSVMPKSMILLVDSYRVTQKVEPKTPENEDDWLVGYF